MIEHIVLIQWSEKASEDSIHCAMAALRQLKNKVPGIVDLSCGADFSGSDDGYTHGLVVRFKDRAALEAYLEHPEHHSVVQKFINPIRGKILALDYEF